MLRTSRLVLAASLLSSALSPVAAAQTGTLDQVSPFGSAAASCGAQSAWFNGNTSALVWQCEVEVGVAGILEGFELELSGTNGAQLDARVIVGAGWNTGAPVWSGSYTKLTPNTEIAWFDMTSANLQLNVGDLFVIELQGNDTGTGIQGTYVPPAGGGAPCYHRDLFLLGPGCYSDCGWRIGFHTYMLGGGGGPWLTASNLVSGQTSNLSVANATPGGVVGFGYSVAGPGPSTASVGGCGPLSVDLSAPIRIAGTRIANGAGLATLNAPVPAGTTGVQVWLQALDVSSCTLTNALAEIIG